MPLGIDPETLILIGIVGGIGSAVTYSAYSHAEKAGAKLTAEDLLPMPPPYPPLPRFLYNKELLDELRGKK